MTLVAAILWNVVFVVIYVKINPFVRIFLATQRPMTNIFLHIQGYSLKALYCLGVNSLFFLPRSHWTPRHL